MDVETYIHMGGYAFNVWGSYGLAFVVYAGFMIHALAKFNRLNKQDKK